MKVTITTAIITKAGPKAKSYEIRDTKTTGFLVRVLPNGRKSFYCEYKRGGRLKIGEANVWKLKEARERAKEIIFEFQKTGSVDVFRAKPEKTLTYLQFLHTHYFEWVDVNHKSALKTRRRLLNDCRRFHSIKIDSITPQMVEKWRTERVTGGNSPHTANRCFAYLRASLSKAVEWGFLENHPLRRMKLMRTASNVKARFLSVEEEERLRSALNDRECKKAMLNPSLTPDMFADHLMPMVLLSINTGLRRGELFTLRWEAINLAQRRLTIRAEISKSKKERHIPLNKEAMKVLNKWQCYQTGASEYVFHNQGVPFSTIRKGWVALLEIADVKNFRWHDLRHHFASRLAISGVDLNTIRELLGHASYATTLRYAHLSEDHKAAAVALLE